MQFGGQKADEEALTFMRALMGQRNQFKLGPGSISENYSGGNQCKLNQPTEDNPFGHA